MIQLTEIAFNLIKDFELTYWEDVDKRKELGIKIFDEMGLCLRDCDYTTSNELEVVYRDTTYWLKIKYDSRNPFIPFIFVLN